MNIPDALPAAVSMILGWISVIGMIYVFLHHNKKYFHNWFWFFNGVGALSNLITILDDNNHHEKIEPLTVIFMVLGIVLAFYFYPRKAYED